MDNDTAGGNSRDGDANVQDNRNDSSSVPSLSLPAWPRRAKRIRTKEQKKAGAAKARGAYVQVGQKWIITEYRWPRVEDHVCWDIDLPAAGCSDLADPAYAALAGNLELMQTFGAKIAEGVDGYLASRWVHRNLGLAHHKSPWLRGEEARAAACEKACVFQS